VSTLAKLLAAGAVVLAFAPFPAAPLLALVAAAAAALAVEPGLLRRVGTLRLLLLILVFAILNGVLIAQTGGVARGLSKGLAVFGRTGVLLILATLVSHQVNAEQLLALSARLRLRRLGLVLSLALNAFPHLVEAWREAWIALAVRRFRARPRLADLPRLAETLLAHTGRVADEAAEAAALRGHSTFSAPPLKVPAGPQLVVVTGRAGGGKTTALRATAASLRERRIDVAGFLQLPIVESGARVGFIVHDLQSGDECRLATLAAPGFGQHGTGFRFEPRGFALARRALARAGAGSVIVADEIGPVELRGGGHLPALRRVMARARPVAVLLGVRPQLVPAFLARLAPATALVVDVDETANAPAAVLAAVAPLHGTR
jgi:nucleoside-triphosphatase THEP1